MDDTTQQAGPVQAALEAAVTSAPHLGEADRGTVALALAMAGAFDRAAVEGNAWALAQVAGRLTVLLRELRLTPMTRTDQTAGAEDDPLESILTELRALQDGIRLIP